MTRPYITFAVVALLLAAFIVRWPNERPSFTDAFYHYNAAVRLAQGDGFVNDYLWTYIGAPDALPARSHLYWLPGTSLIAAAGMTLFGISYGVAQVGLVLCLWGGALLTFHLGWQSGGMRRAWAAGLLVLMGGFFGRFWGTTDTFAPYLLFGGLALWTMQRAIRHGSAFQWLVCGLLCGAGHLIRSDGLLLVMVGVLMLVLRREWRALPLRLAALVAGYLLVMGPWFAFNLQTLGTPLPVGGAQAIWYTSYDDLFSYPPDANPATFFADGIGLLLSSRWDALVANFQTLLVVQGFIVLGPFMLWALWRRRQEAAWWPVMLFALGLHAAFTFVFPFPGVRGGLFHGAAALMPFWAVLALEGIDSTVDWVARRRRHWRPASAKRVFTLAAVVMVALFSLSTAGGRRATAETPPYFDMLAALIPPDSRVMRNDPAELYFFTGLGGVVLPNEPYNVVEQLVALYGIDFVLLEYPNVPQPLAGAPVPPHWRRIDVPFEGVELYATQRPAP